MKYDTQSGEGQPRKVAQTTATLGTAPVLPLELVQLPR
jgi:hypothetical protein